MYRSLPTNSLPNCPTSSFSFRSLRKAHWVGRRSPSRQRVVTVAEVAWNVRPCACDHGGYSRGCWEGDERHCVLYFCVCFNIYVFVYFRICICIVFALLLILANISVCVFVFMYFDICVFVLV